VVTRPVTSAVLALGAVVAALGCGDGGAGGPRHAAAAPGHLVLRSALMDHARAGRGATVVWSTSWQLCWRAQGRAESFELQPLTSEGAGRVRRTPRHCFALGVAAGNDRPGARAAHRAEQLATTRSQLAYRVRAIGAGGRCSPWSCVAETGFVATGGGACSDTGSSG
jgi:hypothetical protein